MRITRCVGAGAALAVLLGAARLMAGAGQSPQASAAPQQPTFKSSTALVEVDATVLDDKGEFLKGLTANDVQLFEDGKPQKIQQFFLVNHYGGADAGSTAPIPTDADVPEAYAHRVFVIMFDEAHLANTSLARAKQGAETFVRDYMAPGDVGGVFVDRAMYKDRLSTDKIELVAGIRSARPAFDNRQALLAPFLQFPRIDSEYDASRIADGATDVVNQLAAQACSDDPDQCRFEGGVTQIQSQIEHKANQYVGQARVLTAQTIQNLDYVVDGLSHFPGRKTLVLITEGLYVEESRPILQTVAARAARGGTTIYTIDGRGLINQTGINPDVSQPDLPRSTSFDNENDGQMILTQGTGGFMIHGIDQISRALGLVMRDTSTYYVIGYQPENAVMDGKFRKISVRTKVADAHVRARTGYLATALPPISGGWR